MGRPPAAERRQFLTDNHSDLMAKLGVRLPVIQAPMAGGATTLDLVSAVSEKGGLGFLAAAYSSPAEIVDAGSQLAARIDRPFGVNLFAPVPVPPPPELPDSALRFLAPFHAELGLAAPELPERTQYDHAEQFAAALETGASVLSFTFGVLPTDEMAAAKAKGMLVLGTATTVDEAVTLEASGVDAVVAQGSEAGAHRGTFQDTFEASMVGTMALVPQVVDAVTVPVVASGGIMDGRGVAAALALGAEAVQMGTAFLTCHESGIPEAHKQAILAAHEHQTALTSAFSGRPSRGIVNRLVASAREAAPGSILPFPYQNALTRPLRRAAAEAGLSDYLSLWAGQGVRLARPEAASDLLERIDTEIRHTISRLGELGAR